MLTTVSEVNIARSDALAALLAFKRELQEQVAYRAAVAGNGDGVLDVPYEDRRIYVQLGAAGGDVAEAQTDLFKPNLDEAILLQRVRVMGTGGWLVLGVVKGDAPCVDVSSL